MIAAEAYSKRPSWRPPNVWGLLSSDVRVQGLERIGRRSSHSSVLDEVEITCCNVSPARILQGEDITVAEI